MACMFAWHSECASVGQALAAALGAGKESPYTLLMEQGTTIP